MPCLTLFAIALGVLAQVREVETAPPVVVTVRFGSEDTVSFRLSKRVVTDIDLHVRGAATGRHGRRQVTHC
jgi:hypothetical protein